PDRGAEAALDRKSVPAITLFAIAGDGVQTPEFFTRLRIVSGDEATTRLCVTATRHALDDDAICNQRACGIAPALGPVGRLHIPHHLAGLGIQCDDMRV